MFYKKTIAVECSCDAPEHLITFKLFHDPDDMPELSVYAQLKNHRSVFWRIVTAVKYLFNKAEPYGHWDCTAIVGENLVELRDMLADFEARTAQWQKDTGYKLPYR